MADFYGFNVGDTPLYQVVELGDRLASKKGRPVVWVKDEGLNGASRTMKDRLAAYELQRHDYLDDDVVFAVMTHGNAGRAFGELCRAYERETGKKRGVVSIVDRTVDKTAKKKLSQYGTVIELDLGKEYLSKQKMVDISRERMNGRKASIVPIGGIDYNGRGYKSISRELHRAGVGKGWHIVPPVGEGDLMANMVLGFEELGEMPHFIGATTEQNHPFSGGQTNCNRVITDKLATRYSDFESYLKGLCARHNHQILTVTYEERGEELGILRKLNINTSPTSGAAFAAARKYSQEAGFSDGENVVILNTGYEPEMEISRWTALSRYAKAAGILLLGSLPFLAGDVPKSQVEALMKDRWNNEYLQQTREELAKDPRLNDMYAYALWRGGMGKIDERAFNDVSYYYTANDIIAREMYNKGGSFRENIVGFQRWLNEQKGAREEKLNKRRLSLKEQEEYMRLGKRQ